MDYCFRFALAAGFLALPISLFAEEKGSPSGGDHRPKGQDQHMRQQLEAKLKELKQQHPQLTPEQKEKVKAAMQQMEQQRKEHPELAQQHREKMKAAMQEMEQRKEHYQEMKAKLENHKQEMQSKLANWKENHPSDTPPGKQQGDEDKRQLTGDGSKGKGEHFRGGGHPGGEHGGGHSGGGHAGGHK